MESLKLHFWGEFVSVWLYFFGFGFKWYIEIKSSEIYFICDSLYSMWIITKTDLNIKEHVNTWWCMIFIGNKGKCSLFSYRILRFIMQQKPLSWHSSIMPKSSTESTRSYIWNPACFPRGECRPEYICDTALPFIRSRFKALLPVMPCGLIFHTDIPK